MRITFNFEDWFISRDTYIREWLGEACSDICKSFDNNVSKGFSFYEFQNVQSQS